MEKKIVLISRPIWTQESAQAPHPFVRDEAWALHTRSWLEWESIYTEKQTGFPTFLSILCPLLETERTQCFQPKGGRRERYLWARCLLFQLLLFGDVLSRGSCGPFLQARHRRVFSLPSLRGTVWCHAGNPDELSILFATGCGDKEKEMSW